MGIPVILGLEEAISGTIHQYLGERGYVALAVEGGQHTAPSTPLHLESALWIALVSSGVLDATELTELDRYRAVLSGAAVGTPPVIEVFYRHGIEPDDAFQMKDGYRNFSPVRAGEVVARDRSGDIRVMEDAMLVLPNYQRLGDDGFFLGRRVRRVWLRISTAVRTLRVDRLLPLLPGVHRDPADERVLRVDARVARWLVREIFHLAGFSKYRVENRLYAFRRRLEKPVR